MINLMKGDCLERMKEIESGSVDLIVCDLPYGTMNTDGGRKLGINGWDNVINTKSIMAEADRILRKNGKMCLFAQQPFTTELINGAIPNLPFNYGLVWEKDSFANALGVKKAPVNYFEDILVFSKIGGLERSGVNSTHPLKQIFNDCLLASGKTKQFFIDLIGASSSHYFTNGVQFRLPVLDKFNALNDHINFPITYTEMIEISRAYKEEQTRLHYEQYPSTFNLLQGNKFKSNILKYKKDYDGFHPTQKPVLLLEDLIKTFSNEGDLVVDMTMGSGSTGCACVNTNRSFIGIEMDETYFNIAQKRINEA